MALAPEDVLAIIGSALVVTLLRGWLLAPWPRLLRWTQRLLLRRDERD
jgi:hypothetical protein